MNLPGLIRWIRRNQFQIIGCSTTADQRICQSTLSGRLCLIGKMLRLLRRNLNLYLLTPRICQILVHSFKPYFLVILFFLQSVLNGAHEPIRWPLMPLFVKVLSIEVPFRLKIARLIVIIHHLHTNQVLFLDFRPIIFDRLLIFICNFSYR